MDWTLWVIGLVVAILATLASKVVWRYSWLWSIIIGCGSGVIAAVLYYIELISIALWVMSSL